MAAKHSNKEQSIRRAFRSRHLRHYAVRDDVLVIDELGLAHARSRIDLAVFNGHLHGYEIKSAGDTLDRLDRQLKVYCEALQKLTLIVANRHLDAAMDMIPKWCGVIELVEGPRGGMSFNSHRRAHVNEEINPFMMAHLLWREEVQALLKQRGASAAEVRAPRKDLYKLLVDAVPTDQLATSIKQAMLSRKNWRDHQLLS